MRMLKKLTNAKKKRKITVLTQLNPILSKIQITAPKDKKKVILCDDYGSESYIPEVEKAINDFRKKNNLQLNLIENRFAEITT